MQVHHVALVSDTPQLSLKALLPVAAAMNKQVLRDYIPAWGIPATISAFADRKSVPHGYWPIFVGSEDQQGGGVHMDANQQPYALVDYTYEWTIAASHECLEMLTDPLGQRLVVGPSIDPSYKGNVSYLVEVGDPCEDTRYGYQIDGHTVTDFVTPDYYREPLLHTATHPRYDVTRAIHAPLEVLPGGYLSWMRSDGVWYQKTNFGAVQIDNLGRFDKKFASIRAWIDSRRGDRG